MIHLRLAAFGLAGLLAITVSADDSATPQYLEDQHYTVLENVPPAQAPEGKTELIEFFWYGCPHCHKMEPLLKQWLEERTDTVHLRLLPTVFSARWAIGARVYYALESMGRLDLHPVVFYLVHEQGRPLKTGEGIGRMLEPFEIDPAAFSEVFRSQAVTDRLEEARELPEAYGIDGVPALVVDGRYRITTKNATSYQMILDIADFLIREKP